MDEDDDHPAVVIDNGSYMVKAGFGGDDCFRAVFPSIVGTPRYDRTVVGSQYKNTYVGDEAQIKRDILAIRRPCKYPNDPNWDDMEKIWHHTFYNELRVNPAEHHAILTEEPLTPKRHSEKMTEIFFESFEVPVFKLAIDAVLSLYASGRTTGCVLISGYNSTYVVPIHEGFALTKDIRRLDIAGNQVTQCLNKTLQGRGYNFYSTSEKQHVIEMKERLCYTAFDFDSEMEACSRSLATEKTYQLPDGASVQIRDERFRCVEAMFKPSLANKGGSRGLHEILYDSLRSTHEDIRKEMFDQIVLDGGNTMFPGFQDRIHKELSHLAPEGTKIKVTAPPERKASSWIGGSIIASVCHSPGWISKQDYEESGPTIVHKIAMSKD